MSCAATATLAALFALFTVASADLPNGAFFVSSAGTAPSSVLQLAQTAEQIAQASIGGELQLAEQIAEQTAKQIAQANNGGEVAAANPVAIIAEQIVEQAAEQAEREQIVQANNGGEVAAANPVVGGEGTAPTAPSSDDPVGLFQLSANLLTNSSSLFDGEARNSELGALLKSHGKQPSAELDQLLAAVPRNLFGKIDAAAARYALHRLFVTQHGWRIEGLDPDGQAWNSSSLADVAVLRRLPAPDLERLRKGWDERGLTVDEVALLAATIEGLLHDDYSERLRLVFQLSGLPTDREVALPQAQTAVERCIASYIMGDRVSRHTWSKVKTHHRDMRQVYPGWDEMRDFAHGFVADRAGFNLIGFAAASSAMKAIGDAHGRFHVKQCLDMKKMLLPLEDHSTGRVRLADFYGENVFKGKWQLGEGVDYLRKNGALDEGNPSNVRVIIPNYVNGMSNCIGASDYHSICCISECEGIRSRIEQSLGKPTASPEEIASVVAALPSSTTPAKSSLEPAQMLRLKRIASEDGGLVPIYGRLFQQWLHHAYPRECEYPHLAGQTSPLDVYDMEKTGGVFMAPIKEMMSYASDSVSIKKRREAPVETVPWVQHEELLGGEDAAALKVPPLFVAFHTALLVSTGLGMGWFLRSALGLGCGRSKGVGFAKRSSDVFLPMPMV